MFQSAPGSAAAGAAHHLVGDHQYLMPVANGADRLRVSGRSRHHPARRPHDGLENESRHTLRAEGPDPCIELSSQRSGELGSGQSTQRAVSVGRGHERHIEQAAFERAPALQKA